MIRHGDFVIIPLEQAQQLFPEAFRITATQPDGVVADVPRTDDGALIFGYGETSGHMHVVADAERLITAERHGDIITMKVAHPTIVQHVGYDGPRDHNDLDLAPGEWAIVRQREYNPVMDTKPTFVFD